GKGRTGYGLGSQCVIGIGVCCFAAFYEACGASARNSDPNRLCRYPSPPCQVSLFYRFARAMSRWPLTLYYGRASENRQACFLGEAGDERQWAVGRNSDDGPLCV